MNNILWWMVAGVIVAAVWIVFLYHNAEFAASIIPGSKLMSYKSGEHILMTVEQEAIRTAVRKHILGQNEVLQVTEN